jgi:hypothetical protein
MSKNTIILKNYLNIYEEFEAASAITPGMLVELDSSKEVKPHVIAGGNVLPMVAIEDELQGNGIDDVYAADDRVQCWVPQRGEEGYLILKDGEDVAIGDFLESGGGGVVVKHTPDTESLGADSSGNITTIYTNQIVGVALEAVDLSDSSGAESSGALGYNKRIMVKFV